MTAKKMDQDRRIAEVVRHLQPPSGFRPWHGGASVLGALRGVSAEAAAWKPYPDRLSIWELTLHIAYWNYAVWRRLTDADKASFQRTPANWPAVPDPITAKAWDDDRVLLREMHDKLIEAVANFDSARLDDQAGKQATTYADLITGILLHDTYHVGQIQMLKRLWRSR